MIKVDNTLTHKIKIIARGKHVNCASRNPDNDCYGIRLGAFPR